MFLLENESEMISGYRKVAYLNYTLHKIEYYIYMYYVYKIIIIIIIIIVVIIVTIVVVIIVISLYICIYVIG